MNINAAKPVIDINKTAIDHLLKGTDINSEFIAFDLETTGLSANYHKILEIGAVKIHNLEIKETFQTFANPEKPIPHRITQINGINDEMVKDAPSQEQALLEFKKFCGDTPVLIAHNAPFDTSFINAGFKHYGIEFIYTFIDSLKISRRMLPHLSTHKLWSVVKELNLGNFNAHRAVDDAEMAAKIFIALAVKY
ncbi:MAG: exonuclease domain-containing protein [Treponema sp.]|nr:exonuclease domain-containing protein [Treponema sp.]